MKVLPRLKKRLRITLGLRDEDVHEVSAYRPKLLGFKEESGADRSKNDGELSAKSLFQRGIRRLVSS